MMSRFVSAGAINAETGEVVVAEETKKGDDGVGGAAAAASAVEPRKNAEWEIVQRELEAERKRREEARLKSVEGGERSLYDVLQANKGAFFLSLLFHFCCCGARREVSGNRN